MNQPAQTSLHIPVGINFDCTGCGNCCFSWPVPLNQEDVSRLEALTGGEASSFVRYLGVKPGGLAAFTHSLEKRSDGRCLFLDDANGCQLHHRFGPQAKPSMCQLFPYTFTPTPTGVYASVSFASTGVLSNSGRPLLEQTDHLLSRWSLMQKLNPDYAPDWHAAQLLDGVPISWQEYLPLDREILDLLQPGNGKGSILQLCRKACSILAQRLPYSYPLERSLTEVPPETIDRTLIKFLLQFYLPNDVFDGAECDFPARAMVQHLVTPDMSASGRSVNGDDSDHELGELDPQTDQLLRRFFYCRVFSKLYFGPGYNYLSVAAGLHHLCCLIALVRIVLKTEPRTADGDTFSAAAELVRKLERRLTMARFSRESTSVLEVLLTSPSRAERILSLAA
jgi:Fe-S-cluster containining protein